MSKIIKRVKQSLIVEEQKFANDKIFDEFNQYYKKLAEMGIAKKETYDIPLVDTIGRKYYNEINAINLDV